LARCRHLPVSRKFCQAYVVDPHSTWHPRSTPCRTI